MEQVERIRGMEECMEQAEQALASLREALESYEASRKAWEELEEYYGSARWREDFDADSAGMLPADLRRGVLSEDGVWNLLEERRELLEQMRRIAGKAD